MKKLKTFEEMIKENEGVPTPSVIPGMGDVIAPEGDVVGSGDSFPPIGKPTEQPINGKKKKKTKPSKVDSFESFLKNMKEMQ